MEAQAPLREAENANWDFFLKAAGRRSRSAAAPRLINPDDAAKRELARTRDRRLLFRSAQFERSFVPFRFWSCLWQDRSPRRRACERKKTSAS